MNNGGKFGLRLQLSFYYKTVERGAKLWYHFGIILEQLKGQWELSKQWFRKLSKKVIAAFSILDVPILQWDSEIKKTHLDIYLLLASSKVQYSGCYIIFGSIGRAQWGEIYFEGAFLFNYLIKRYLWKHCSKNFVVKVS